jgi:Skp family chaperone for outer membrane proteins|tara:strand:+ start:721 stop:1464 length:744 start_codon:yes stop_codon:yes gene_type:complete
LNLLAFRAISNKHNSEFPKDGKFHSPHTKIQQGVLIVKNHLLLTSTIAICLTFFINHSGNTVQAQQARTGTTVAVVDIAVVMENNAKFKSMLSSIQSEITQFDGKLEVTRKEVTLLVDELKGYNPGTTAYSQLEERIAKIQSDVQVQMQIKRKNVLQQEAKVFHECYIGVQKTIATFCEQNGISLVLNYDSKAINPQSRESVLKGVNRDIVYQRSLNITKYIVDAVNKGNVTAAPANLSNPSTTVPR